MDFLFKNDLTLLSAGLIVALPVLLILLFVRKMYKKFSFIMLTVTMCATLGLSVTGGILMPSTQSASEESSETDEASQGIVYSSESDYLAAFSGFLLEGKTDEAERIIKECAQVHGYSDKCSVMSAHLAFAEQNYAKASVLYSKVAGQSNTEKLLSASEKLVAYSKADGAVSEQLKTSGIELSISDAEITEARALLNGGAMTLLQSTLSSSDKVDGYREAAKITGEIEQLWIDATENKNDVTDKLEGVEKKLSEVANKKKLNRIGVWRVSRMKLRLLGDNYAKFASELDEYATCEEYAIALDLYLNGKIGSKTLKKSFGIESFSGTNEIVSQLKTIKSSAELSDEQEEALEDQIERISEYSKNELYYHLENELIEHAKDRDNIRNSSKIYLSLAEYSGSLNRTSKRNEYFSEALTAAANSDDAAYAEAMNGLADAISGSGDYESVKDVEKWASQAAENSSFIKGSGEFVRTPEKEAALKEAVQDYTIKASAAITINSIDTSKFNEITATIQVSDEFMSEKELKNLLKLKDCSIDISTFTIKKVVYDKANIILCCDNSGSMSGSVGALKNAVNKFLGTTTKEEHIGFYTFDSSILQSLALGSSIEDIKTAVDKMDAMGGTNIYGTVNTILSGVETDLESNNILILMTDGQDGYHSVSAESIGALAFSKGYVIYVMGMGSGIEVDSLQALADVTGGQFIYSPTDAQLESLYRFIHGQVKNKYKVTYKTVDTLTLSDRTLEIVLKDQNVSDMKYYSLSESDEQTAILSFDYDVSVSGLETRHMVKQKNVTNINVLGTGFKNTDSMYITLKGDRTYNLRASYIDENTFRISVPAEIALGLYDMEVKLNNRFAIFKDELTVSDGTVVEVRFGGYHFTAAKITEDDTTITMTGNVTMNGWLTFNGTVVLAGDIDGTQITMTDYSGCRISYANSGVTKGVAKYLKDKSIPLPLPMLGNVTLFNSASSMDEYPTSSHTIPVLKIIDFMRIDTPTMRLYPDKISLNLKKGSADLPFQDLLVSEVSDKSPFSFDFDCTGTLTQNNISIKCDAALNQSTGNAPFLVKFLDTTATMEKTLGKLSFDTAEGSLGVEFNVKLPMFPIDTYVGLGIQWVNMSLDGVQLRLDRDFTKMVGPVPITFSDFSLGFVGLAQKTKNASNETISALTLEGKMQISGGKVSAIVPKLKKYVGDVAVLQIPDATFKCGLSRFSIEAEATLKLLSCVELAQAKIALGNHDFSNPLLGINKENVVGVYVMLKKGLSWDAHNLFVELSGKGEFAINNRFVGAAYDGTAELELNWWIFEKTLHRDGQALIGFYTDYSSNTQFTIRASYNDGNKRKGAIFYITDRGKMDYDLNYKY